ncbi:helix-turn-helix domain-containing protein [Vibrio vulnificus]|uniref:helix-turn-helix domain-containing protein n=1 Tax=Vibrio vulnificus TaxID=672 RepID=UPI003ED8B73E
MKKKEWLQTTELLGLNGMPSTIGGINYKAKAEGWVKRKAEGVKGRAFEYHIESLPTETQLALSNEVAQVKEEQPHYAKVSVPYYDIYASAGNGSVPIGGEYSPYSIDIHPQLLLDQGIPTTNLFMMTVKGDSMETTLFDGDLVIVRRELGYPRVLEGVYVIRIDSQLFIKRIQYNKFEGYMQVDSDNTYYRSFTIHGEDLNAVQIIGEAVLTLGRVRKITMPKALKHDSGLPAAPERI